MKDLNYDIYINKTSKQFDERGFECILATVLNIGSLTLLLFFPIMGFALSAFAYGYLCVGLKKYYISIATDKYLPIESIFFQWRKILKAFCLKVATTLITALWTVVFIIPGIVTALNYSMASFIMAEDDKVDALGAMVKSKKLVYGYRAQILIVYLSYMLVSLTALVLLSAIGASIIYFSNAPVWVIALSMGIIYLFALIILIVPYFELGLTNVYLTLKINSEKQKKTTSSKKTTKKQSERKSD